MTPDTVPRGNTDDDTQDTDTSGSQSVEDLEVASQEAYEEQTLETFWVRLPRANQRMEVQQIPKLKLVTALLEYDIVDTQNLPEDVAPDEVQNMQDELDDETLDEIAEGLGGGGAEQAGKFVQFMNDVIAPRIVQPKAYWNTKPDDFPDDVDGFDLTVLHEEDTQALMQSLVGAGLDSEEFPGEPADN
jgi:hypothetical protein